MPPKRTMAKARATKRAVEPEPSPPRRRREPLHASKGPAAIPVSKPAAPSLASGVVDGDVRGLVEDLALLTAVNNLMAQTAFLTVERMRIASEVVDENVSDDFGAKLFQRSEDLVRASDEVILRVLDQLSPEGERAELVRSLVEMRRAFAGHTRRPLEQRRLTESLERMYR